MSSAAQISPGRLPFSPTPHAFDAITGEPHIYASVHLNEILSPKNALKNSYSPSSKKKKTQTSQRFSAVNLVLKIDDNGYVIFL